MKKTEITQEIFETWKAEMREVFKNEPQSMNGIAMGLRIIDNPEKKKLHVNWDKQLLQFYENDLARGGKLDCEYCGKPMEVYYTVQCFHCLPSKPKIENHEGNFICASKWISNQEPDFNKDELWTYLTNNDILQSNDSYIVLPSETQNKDLKIFHKHYPEEHIKWFVSW